MPKIVSGKPRTMEEIKADGRRALVYAVRGYGNDKLGLLSELFGAFDRGVSLTVDTEAFWNEVRHALTSDKKVTLGYFERLTYDDVKNLDRRTVFLDLIRELEDRHFAGSIIALIIRKTLAHLNAGHLVGLGISEWLKNTAKKDETASEGVLYASMAEEIECLEAEKRGRAEEEYKWAVAASNARQRAEHERFRVKSEKEEREREWRRTHCTCGNEYISDYDCPVHGKELKEAATREAESSRRERTELLSHLSNEDLRQAARNKR